MRIQTNTKKTIAAKLQPEARHQKKFSNATIYVVDDDEQVRDSLRLLAHSIHLNVELHATAQSFLRSYRNGNPCCLLLDVCLPGLNGVELLEHLQAKGIHIPTIVMTAYGEVGIAVRAMKAGALDFVEKPYGRQEMVDLIHRAITRYTETQNYAVQHDEIRSRLATLSEREREIMLLFFTGENTKRVASRLGISPKTVDYHRWNVLKKMNANNMVELAHCVASHTNGDWG